MRQSGKIALGGMTAAVALVFMLLTVIPVSEIGLPAIAGAVLIPVVIELGQKQGLAVYAVVSLLSLLLVSSVESKLLYVAFFGYYPILKALLEKKIRNRVLEWVLKLAVFNASVIAVYWALLTFFHLDAAEFAIGGVQLPWLILLLGNVVFVLYDIGLTRVIGAYLCSWGQRVHRLFRF